MSESQKPVAAGAPSTTDRSRQNAGTAVAAKPGNPARPSKFAGLNLRQRTSESPTVGEPEGEEQGQDQLDAAVPNDPQAGEGSGAALLHPSADAGAHRAAAGTPESPSTPVPASRPASTAPALKTPAAADPPSIDDEQRQSRDSSAPPHLQGRDAGLRRTQAGAGGTDMAPARRRGKRTDPEFVQVTAYIRQETYRRARIKLLESTKPKEFSEVVEELLTRWLRASS